MRGDPDILGVLQEALGVGIADEQFLPKGQRPPVQTTSPWQQKLDQWDDLSPDCQKGLTDALKVNDGVSDASAKVQRVNALNRALSYTNTLKEAAANTGTGWTMLAAIGIRETGFRNIVEANGGDGRGVFQIDIGKHPNLEIDPMNIADAARWAANHLAENAAKLASDHQNCSAAELMQATAASWNFGTGNISGNPATIDIGSTGGNYGSNIMNLMQCFEE